MKLFSKLREILRLDPWVLAADLAKSLVQDVPRLNSLMGMVRSRNVETLAGLGQIKDAEYHASEFNEILAERQIASLFKKNDAFIDTARCEGNAKLAFQRGELRCRITNKRLDYFYTHRDRIDPELRGWLNRMETDISGLLGDVDAFTETMTSRIRLTNGATEDRTRRRALPFLKVTGRLRAPLAAVPYLGTVLSEMGVELTSCLFEDVQSNTVVLVPKNWKTHRTIAKEPTHSLPFQLALDGFLKQRLRTWKIDLSSQTKNQEFARLGSIDGSIATLDLEMASDTLAYNAVAWMLPTEWLRVLDAFRSSSFESPWGTGQYAKYSSMGNGYTFSLETLIFTAACRAVGCKNPAVYGDDIGLPTIYASSLIRLLAFLGFTVNAEKSFANPNSRFRESCGCDYFSGRLVTPFYLRELPARDDLAGLSHVVNGLLPVSLGGPLWNTLRDIVEECKLRLVPWNEDTRSGVFVSPRCAWDIGKLKVERRPFLKGGVVNPNYGFPVYQGYGQVHERRLTCGRRSLLLWHINKASGKDLVPIHDTKRRSALLLQSTGSVESPPNVTVTSEVVVRSRYSYKLRRYAPICSTPLYLILWDEFVWVAPSR